MNPRLGVTALIALLSASGVRAAGGCGLEGAARSMHSDRATGIVFRNRFSHEARIYWIDYEGRRRFYSSLAPGETYTQDTYMTHPWVLTDGAEDCILFSRPAPGATLATIHDRAAGWGSTATDPR